MRSRPRFGRESHAIESSLAFSEHRSPEAVLSQPQPHTTKTKALCLLVLVRNRGAAELNPQSANLYPKCLCLHNLHFVLWLWLLCPVAYAWLLAYVQLVLALLLFFPSPLPPFCLEPGVRSSLLAHAGTAARMSWRTGSACGVWSVVCVCVSRHLN
jgi:hypothetical protein